MTKLEKILNRDALSVRKQKTTRILAEFYEKSARDSGNFTLTVKTDCDFFMAMIMIESLKNKTAFEKTYERERKELADLWPTLSYQERNKLINLKIVELKSRSRFFNDATGNPTWIAFFEPLLNALYDHEMNIFDLDQYFNLYNDYKDRMIPIESYGTAPYTSRFIDIRQLSNDGKRSVFAYDPLKSLFIVDFDGKTITLKRLCLSPELDLNLVDAQDLLNLADLYSENAEVQLIDVLIDGAFVSDQIAKRLEKLRKKL